MTETTMITLTDAAKKQLDSYFAENPKASIRIYLSEGGCAGPRLGLALDEKGGTDDSFDVSGYTFVIKQDLLNEAKPFTVDLNCMGFQVLSSLKLGGGGCSSGSCGSGSCCG
jgi:Fe-S cluster assembly iron-binding protein IscA